MSNPVPTRVARCLRPAALSVFVLLGSAVLALASPVMFDIPAQPASTALSLFSKQSESKVLFPAAELAGVQAKAVKGEMEPLEAIGKLLDGTGYAAKQTGAANFVVKKIEAPATTGLVKGTLTGEGGKGLPNVLVTIRETALSTETDKFGQYVFPKVAAGTYVLVASAPGYQPLHITEVQVRTGRDLLLGKEEMRPAREGVLALDPIVVHADAVEELDKFEVTGTKQKPFEGANVDIPRTIDDAQPYYVFSSKTLDSSGAVNLEEFLKQRLTMNTVGLTNAQTSPTSSSPNNLGNTSSVNLRGLGIDKTLILVNGRRVPATMAFVSEFQPDINGIPMSAIDRVEVLPTSASGIYGSSALGGVINIVLKRDYTGGEVRATYDNTFDTDSAVRTLSATFGTALGSKTQLMLTGQWSDANAMLLQDRRAMLDRNIARILVNNPTFLYSPTLPALGSLTNVAAISGNLVLDNNTPLNAQITYIPAGTAPGTPLATLAPGVVANAGKYDLTLPSSRQSPYGLRRRVGATPEVKSFQASLRHQLFKPLELFAEFRYTGNYAVGGFDPTAISLVVPGAAPTNPFTNNVRVRLPVSVSDDTIITNSITRNLTVGFNAKLPYDWVAEGDYTRSDQYTSNFQSVFNNAALSAALANGTVNPFVDTLRYGVNLDDYLLRIYAISNQRIESFALRGAGSLPDLPWGTPHLATGLEHRRGTMPNNLASTEFEIFTYFPRRYVAESAYAELTAPLVKQKRFPLLHTLEAQVAARMEKFTVSTGTPSTIITRATGVSRFGTPTLGGQPFFGEDNYTQTNYTAGLKYQPVRDIIIRASLANAFIPPTPGQLLENPTQGNTTITSDPKDPTVTGTKIIPSVSGGNSSLDSFNVGVVWQPGEGKLQNLRLNFEYYKVKQHDFIAVLSAQALVNAESLFPDRITRDTAGHITLINLRQLNLFMRENSGFDVTADYHVRTSWGRFTLRGQHSTILTLKTQYAFQVPPYDGAGYPNESNGAIKHKTNATVGWERGNWLVNWTARRTGSYYQAGSPGGPLSIQSANGGVFVNGALTAQGSFVIPTQTYHDLMVEYAFRGAETVSGWRRQLLKDMTVQVGVRNVFDKVAPFDAQQVSNFYVSPYSDIRLRSYWLSVRRTF